MKACVEMKMDKAWAERFRYRWQAVEEVQQQEARAATLELRWRQLNAMYGMSRALQLSAKHDDEIPVYQRWAKLRGNASLRRKA